MKNKKELSLGTVLVSFLILCIMVFLLTLKIAGSSNLPINIEKKGYCKKVYGDQFHYVEEENICKSHNQTKNISEEDFMKVCPDHTFFSKGFNSECFKEGKG